MKTTFKILSHACLWVKRGDTCLIIDPWILGSCYWRSWWNYPEPELDEKELAQVTHVLISHIHWDHWHGASLKKYFKGRQFLVSDEPNTRSYDDLVRLHLGNVRLIKHGQSIDLGDSLKITPYQFGLIHNDTAIVIETPEVKILNANDAKIAGLPLKHIIKKHGPFDFALRSHSTANFRACIKVEDTPTQIFDDNEHYSRSFKLFMDAVQPRFAIPFASNHCYLHKDTFAYNQLITNPIKLKNWIEQHGGLASSTLEIMLPGSSWNSDHGFTLHDLEAFNHIDEKLQDYYQKKLPKLTEYYEYEAKQNVNPRTIEKHEKHLRSIPWLLKLPFKEITIAYKITKDQTHALYFSVDYKNSTLKPVDENYYQTSAIKIDWPILVFNQAVNLNMYAHAFISKRIQVFVDKKKNLKQLKSFINSLENIEHGAFPITPRYIWRTFLAYCYRWREILLYFSVVNQVLIQKKPLYLVEETVLEKSKFP